MKSETPDERALDAPHLVGDDNEIEVSDEFITSVADNALLRIRDKMQAGDVDSLHELMLLCVQETVLETVHELSQDGFCNLHWHRSEIDKTINGLCAFCDESEDMHLLVKCCREKGLTSTALGVRDHSP